MSSFGNFGFFSDWYRSGRSKILDNDVLRTELKASPCQTIEEQTIFRADGKNKQSRCLL